MKRMKKFLSLVLAMVMVLAIGIPVMAAGETGSITIKPSDNVSMGEGEDQKIFNAYKVLDVEIIKNNGEGKEGYVYTVPDELKDFYSDRYGIETTVGDFDYQVAQRIAEEVNDNIADNVFTFAKDVLEAAKKAGVEAKSGEVDNSGNYVIGNLPLGYYVVEDTAVTAPVSALILDTPNTNTEVTVKADKPSVDKSIDGTTDTDSGTADLTKNNSAAVGDKVPYVVNSIVPDMTGYKNYYFVLNDTLSKGLTFNEDVVITMLAGSAVPDDETGDNMAIGTTLTEGTDYTVQTTVNEDGSTGVEIVFKNFIQYKNMTGTPIVITYSATVNENAVLGNTGNSNEVKLTYSNNPNVDSEGDKPGPDAPVGETPKSETRTFVTGIELTKVNGDKEKLNGAKFRIEGTRQNIVIINKEIFEESGAGTYYRLKDGTYTEAAPTAAGEGVEGNEDLYDSTTIKYIKVEEVSKETTNQNVSTEGYVNNGILTFEGLSAGDYTITELIAPNGYNLLPNPIKVTITCTYDDKTNGYVWAGQYTLEESGALKDLNFNPGKGIFDGFEITNNTGVELPSTGGIGTTIFYVLGGILVVGAGIMLVVKKRMSSEK